MTIMILMLATTIRLIMRLWKFQEDVVKFLYPFYILELVDFSHPLRIRIYNAGDDADASRAIKGVQYACKPPWLSRKLPYLILRVKGAGCALSGGLVDDWRLGLW